MIGQTHGGGSNGKIATLKFKAGNYGEGGYLDVGIINDDIGVTCKYGRITLPPGLYRVNASISASTSSAGRLWITLEKKSPTEERLAGGINYGAYATVNINHVIELENETQISFYSWNNTTVDGAGTGPSIVQIEKIKK